MPPTTTYPTVRQKRPDSPTRRHGAIPALCLLFFGLPAAAQTGLPPAADSVTWRLDAAENPFGFAPLHAYDDYWDQTVDFGFGFLRYKPRGYDNRYRMFRANSLSLAEWEEGTPAWNAVYGLNDVGTRIQTGFDFAGRTEERQMLAWQQTRGGRVALSTSNRTYTLRGSAGYRSGENARNGWSYSLFAGRTWAGDGGGSYTVEGMWNDSWAVFGSVSKRFGGDRHRIALTAWYAPNRRALAAASIEEAFDLTGNRLYNPAWGRWNGTRRSARIRSAAEPIAMLSYAYDSGDALRIAATAGVRFGRSAFSGLDWYDAPNPHPDYYRYLPSFYPEGSAERKLADERWRTDESTRQIDWAALAAQNRDDGPRAHYIVASRMRDYREFALHVTADWRPDARTRWQGGFECAAADNLHFKRLDDLLGGGYWLDVDVFAENPEDAPNGTQNDMRYPNREVREGDTFGYKYSMQGLQPRMWARFSRRWRQWDFEAAGSVGAMAFRRFGYYDKQNFPGNESFGWSKWSAHPEWLVQGGAGYNRGGRLRVGFRFTARSLAPTPRRAFISPEYRNALVPGLKNEQMLEAELRADYRVPLLRIHAALFAATVRNRTEVRRFYNDLTHFFCNYPMTGIDTRHIGAELSAEIRLGPRLQLKAAAAVTDCRYTSNPQATVIRESTGEPIATETVYYRGLHTATGPQTIGALELEYAPRGWVFTATLKGWAGNYISPTPLRRSEAAVERWKYTPEARAIAAEQENLGGGATIDLFIGKTIYFGARHRLGLYAGIDNLLNRRTIRASGYESSRLYRKTQKEVYLPLASKYYYARGITFFATASYRF